MKSTEIRKAFTKFFKDKDHYIESSAPMVLKDDPSLMFTNAGMNQFKDIFLGFERPKHSRVANSQKCLRVSGKHNDLEEVGVDTYHHTMFEMLGNWSFGNYFKEEAINWSWELLTDVFKIDPNLLYVTVFEGDKKDGTSFDKDSFTIWENHVPKNRIIKCGKKDNFWEMGSQGPCGPSSEIHIDLRNEAEKSKVDGLELVNQDHPQVIEIWNLVFMEFNRTAVGILEPLEHKHVDTGMGFERLCRVLQNKNSNYDTDIFAPLIGKLKEMSKMEYLGGEDKISIAFRVVVDHLRAVSFSIADGQLPSNTGAGYVIRRILRRAIRYGYQFLNFKTPFINQLLDELVLSFDGHYKELDAQKEFISKIIYEEESSFFNTLSSGVKRIEEIISQCRLKKVLEISGKQCFELYDSFGFPIDLTRLIASENNFSIDEDEFEKCLEEQRERSKSDAQKEVGDWTKIREDDVQEFIGYDHVKAAVKITQYRKVKIKKDDYFQLIFNLTPFYPEGGGQVGDSGLLVSENEKINIIDTKKENGVIVHFTKELPKNLDAEFIAQVDENARLNSAKNHSATHLLHYALRKILGSHVEQKGSLVNKQYLRFDFSHYAKLSKEELDEIEKLVNAEIRNGNPLIEERNIPLLLAKEKGAMMLFGEKYGDSVRTIQFGESIELCGGIHVNSTSKIGQFRIISEGSISSGIRRIEAITGEEADHFINEKLTTLKNISDILKQPNDILEAVINLQLKNTELNKKIEENRKAVVKQAKLKIVENAEDMGNFTLMYFNTNLTADEMKQISFQIKDKHEKTVLLLTSEMNEKPLISLMITEDLVKEMHWNAGQFIKDLSKLIKGGGGGQAFFATAGGSDVKGLTLIKEKTKSLLN
ncbi:MAG: alanine--tRNA ligase [Bacteroidota bacterium]|nr:alanine--tRNA ligase [Bacteroidota bacterium]